MATFKAVVLKAAGQVKKDGTANIKIRVTHKRKDAYIPTDLYIITTDFNNKSGWAKSGPNKDFINLRITNLLKQYREKDILLGENREFMSVTELRKFLIEGKTSAREIDFFKFVEDFVKTVRFSKKTVETYNNLVSSLKNFSGELLPVTEITINYLYRYENYLRSRGVQNGVDNYMRTFRSLFNKCRDHYNEEDSGRILIPHYPFRKYKFPKLIGSSKEHVLTLEELKKLKNYKPELEEERFAIDMFFLMIYLIGIEAKDLFFANKPQQGRLNYIRYKTGKLYSIKIEPEAAEIIERYSGDKMLLNCSEQFRHHTSFLKKINNYLNGEKPHNIKGILPKIGINKNVTTKWARHTWATIARNECGINKDDVALCLGHEDEDNRVTDTYIKYDYSIIDNSNRKVLELFRTY